MKKIRVAVLMGGPSSEHDVSLKSGEMVLSMLDTQKYDSEPLIIGKEGRLDVNRLKGADVAFLALHGKYGEDGCIQGLLESIGLPYTGSGVLASALAMDKMRSNVLFRDGGLLVPRAIVVGRSTTEKELFFPGVLKPADGGSSVGVSIVKNRQDYDAAFSEAIQTSSYLMLQEFVEGREVTCGVLEVDRRPVALPPTEIVPKRGTFFDFASKYQRGGSDEITPPQMPNAIITEIQSIAVRAHELLGCRAYSRTDMIVTPRGIFILETNTLPGMTETSLFPQAARVAGISFPELLDRLIVAAGCRT